MAYTPPAFDLHSPCRCVSGSDSDLLPTAACQLSLFVTCYIAMRVYCKAHDVSAGCVAAVAGLSLGECVREFVCVYVCMYA
jgi:hypothetical protein